MIIGNIHYYLHSKYDGVKSKARCEQLGIELRGVDDDTKSGVNVDNCVKAKWRLTILDVMRCV